MYVGTSKNNKGLRGSYTRGMKEDFALRYARLIYVDFCWPLRENWSIGEF